MTLLGKNIWQIAAGDSDRNFVDVCLRWGVVLNGPGDLGEWSDKFDPEKKLTSRKRTELERFCCEVKDGDLVVLRIGTKDVHGVGRIIGDYEYRSCFSDIDGWDLQHVRRVEWLWPLTADRKPRSFNAHTMKWGDTTQELKRVNGKNDELYSWLEQMDLVGTGVSNLVKLPESTPDSCDVNDISNYLFDRGLGASSLSLVTERINELVRLAKWYSEHCLERPSESEAVAHLVVPLLKALGWSTQKISLERNVHGVGRVDIALFDTAARADESVAMVIEAKRYGSSILTALDQGVSYSRNLSNCDRLVLTDGIRYAIYLKADNNFPAWPSAYLNLSSPRKSYAIFEYNGKECKGAEVAIFCMSPEWTPNLDPLPRQILNVPSEDRSD